MDKNRFAITPPMGWNSYDYYDTTVNEAQVRANADYMAAHLKAFGWEYVACRQIYAAACCLLMTDGCHQKIRPEHVGILNLPAYLILRKFIEHGPHHRRSQSARAYIWGFAEFPGGPRISVDSTAAISTTMVLRSC